MEPAATGPSRAVVSPQEQRIIDSNLQRVLRIPGNDCCADCGAKHPRWASVNLGVVICLECSGIHRKMGVHISKVKSVTLDRWTAQWVTVLEAIGNEVARNYYEHALPSDFKRPTRSDDPNTIENWIRTKYERKNYAPKGVPEPWALVAEGKEPRSVLASAVEEKKNPKSRKSHSSETKKPAAAPAPQARNEPWLLADVEDFAAFGSQPVEPAGSGSAGGGAGPAPAEQQLSATDLRVQAAKATIARLYAAPNKLDFGAPAQPAVRPESLEGLSFFSTPQQQQSGTAAPPIAATGEWATWSSMDGTTTATAAWPGAPGAFAAACPFSGMSAGAPAPAPAFNVTAAAAPQMPMTAIPATAAPMGDFWGASGARLNGQGSPTPLNTSEENKQTSQAHSALSSLDAFALARKVQQPAAQVSAQPPSDPPQHQQHQPASSSPVPMKQQEPLLLI